MTLDEFQTRAKVHSNALEHLRALLDSQILDADSLVKFADAEILSRAARQAYDHNQARTYTPEQE